MPIFSATRSTIILSAIPDVKPQLVLTFPITRRARMVLFILGQGLKVFKVDDNNDSLKI